MTWTTATLAPGAEGNGATAATPGTARRSCVSRPSAARSAGEPTWATSSERSVGPWSERRPTAGRRPCASSCRRDRCRRRTGRAAAPAPGWRGPASRAPRQGRGRRAAGPRTRAQRAQKPVSWPSCGPSAASRRRSRRLSTRVPMKPSIAGSSVIAVAIVSTTVMTEAIARPLRKLSRSTYSPSRATQTVPPAKSTARPAVLSERTAASSERQAGLEAVAVPRDDEQRVVDADAQPDEGGQCRGDDGRRSSRARAARWRRSPCSAPRRPRSAAAPCPGANRRRAG